MYKSKKTALRRSKGPTRIANHLASGNPRLRAIQQQANANRALRERLWPAIPTQLQAHCDLANFREPTLVFVASSPVWAARLRHISPQILHAACKLCKINAQKLIVRIEPVRQPTIRNQPPKSLPASAANHLREAAATVEDETLKDVLLTIARRCD